MHFLCTVISSFLLLVHFEIYFDGIINISVLFQPVGHCLLYYLHIKSMKSVGCVVPLQGLDII